MSQASLAREIKFWERESDEPADLGRSPIDTSSSVRSISDWIPSCSKTAVEAASSSSARSQWEISTDEC